MGNRHLKLLIGRHKDVWRDKFFTVSTAIGALFLIASFFINYGAVIYSSKSIGNATTDLLLEILPVVNTDLIFSEGALIFVIFLAILLMIQPKTIPFTLKSISLFVLIRSISVTLTHLGPIPEQIPTDLSNFGYFSAGADLFFSGHTGLPFLMALLFWKDKPLRRIFIFSSIIAAIAVILGHLHYTIDVFSAYFITYGIFKIAQKAFPNDHRYFIAELRESN